MHCVAAFGGLMPFPCLKHHIAFASDQVLPTLLGASVPEARPDWVHLVVTPEMRRKAANLRKALEGRGCRCRDYALHDTRQQAVFDLLDRIREECGEATPALNLTGGTKLMTLAAAEWAYACEVPTFYIDTAADQLILPGRHWEYLNLPDVLDVRSLLLAHGYQIGGSLTCESVARERRAVLADMLHTVCTTRAGERALRRLNACAQQASEQPGGVVGDKGQGSGAWTTLLELCSRAGMLQHTDGFIRFPSEEARRWCNGVWFEEFVHMTLYKLHGDKHITSWASSVTVRKGDSANELDALFSVRNRLFIIECKTSDMVVTNRSGDPNKVTSILYKADSLHDRLGGIFAQAVLCSVLPLQRYELNRARDMGILVIAGPDLLHLDEKLIRWTEHA